MRAEMIEKIVENDDYLTEKYLMGEEITDDELLPALRAATIAGKVHPVLCGSALKNKGVQLMLDKVVELLPSPLDVPPVTGHDPKTDEELVRHATDDEPTGGAGLQDSDRPVCRAAGLLPRLFRRAADWHEHAQQHHRRP